MSADATNEKPDLLVLAARAWKALCAAKGVAPGSAASREIAREIAADTMAILHGAMARTDGAGSDR